MSAESSAPTRRSFLATSAGAGAFGVVPLAAPAQFPPVRAFPLRSSQFTKGQSRIAALTLGSTAPAFAGFEPCALGSRLKSQHPPVR